MFTRDVARGRNTSVERVRNDMGQGRVLGADAALRANMVDGVQTFDQVVSRMAHASRVRRPQGRPPSALNAASAFLRNLAAADRAACIRKAEEEIKRDGGYTP